MLKKLTLCALGVASFAADAAWVHSNDSSRLWLGGRAETIMTSKDSNKYDGAGEEVYSSWRDTSRLRLRVFGEHFVDYQTRIFGNYEIEMHSKNNNTQVRQTYVGIKNDQYGTVSFGKQETALKKLSKFTYFGSSFAGNEAVYLVHGAQDRIDRNFFVSTDYDRINISADYVISEHADNNTYGATVIYSHPLGLKLGANYQGGEHSGDGVYQYTFGANYNVDAYEIGAIYTSAEDHDDNELTGVELAARYRFIRDSDRITLALIYNNLEKTAEGERSSSTETDWLSTEVEYRRGKARAYVGYQVDLSDDDDNAIRLGLRYDF